MKANPQPKGRVCVIGEGGGADLGEIMAHTQPAKQWAVTKPDGHSDIINEINTDKMRDVS